MKYYWRVFLWENGGKSTEYTDYLVMPVFLEDRLNEEMDTGEIVLEGMPIATRSAFPPKAKFRIERYLGEDSAEPQRTWDLVVEHDDVEEYAGLPEVCCHRVHLIEASVVAQGMHVDNIALTYELQDVTLNYKTIRDDKTNIGDKCESLPGGYSQAIRVSQKTGVATLPDRATSYFRNSYRYVWDFTSFDSIKKLKLNNSAGEKHSIIFKVPKLICEGCYSSGKWDILFEMNTVTRVYKIKTFNGKEIENDIILIKHSGPTELPINDDEVYFSDGTNASLRAIIDWSRDDTYMNEFERRNNWTTHPIVATASDSYADKEISFTTEQLSLMELDSGYSYCYKIECLANPTNQNGMIEYYEKRHIGMQAPYLIPPTTIAYKIYSDATTTANNITQASSVSVLASFYCTDMSSNAVGGPFLMKGVKYSCFDLLRRALLTTDNYLIDNSKMGLDSILDSEFNELGLQFPIILSSEWITRLKNAKMQETILEEKNLWEVFLQIGYYLHAIPYLEFTKDGTDRFVLGFRQLGSTNEKRDTNIKLTVFNSKNLSDYFTQYDSYVTNMFSPQNIIEEWITVKSNDHSYIINNDNSEIITSRPITEILEFDIMCGQEKEDALPFIFEESIYQTLTNDNPIKISPAKGNSIFYSLGKNRIQGLNYVPPQKNEGTYLMALQEICRRLFGKKQDYIPENLLYNNLRFHIKYRTQENLRISQIRPDIQQFMKNSSFEKYPHHEQYFGQQDKIIDSERFSANLFGRLIRVGNSIYERQEYVSFGEEKESGDLVEIDKEPYYVTGVENEYYPDAIFQKVTYSKNFNQLSQIVTIPSEPRFYEVSERSKIRREVRIMEFLSLSNERDIIASAPRFLNKNLWRDFIKQLIFNNKSISLPNFAYTRFIADEKRKHYGSYGQYIEFSNLFPSSDIDRADPNNVIPKKAKNFSECIVPLLHYPLHDGIVFTWDMEDNFKAGDFIERVIHPEESEDNAYAAQQSLRYVDIMGRADLFTFKLFYKAGWNNEQIPTLIKAEETPEDNISQIMLPSPYTIGLDKDCREELSFNYQINLLHYAAEKDDDFITFPNLFGEKDSELKLCLLNEQQSLFNENISLSAANIIADNVHYDLLDDTDNAIEIRIRKPVNIDLNKVKSIVFYQENDIGDRYAYILKNVAKLPNDKKLNSWWIRPVLNN